MGDFSTINESILEGFGKDLCATCRRLIIYLYKHHYKKIAKNKVHSKEATIKFAFVRGKFMAYLFDLNQLATAIGKTDWADVYLETRGKFIRYENQIRPFLEKYLLNNHT